MFIEKNGLIDGREALSRSCFFDKFFRGYLRMCLNIEKKLLGKGQLDEPVGLGMCERIP